MGFWHRQYWDALQYLCRVLCAVLFRVRCDGRRHIPRRGGAILVSNHQSYLDPVLVGIGACRYPTMLARRELFGFAPLRWLIRSLNGIPIDRDGADVAAVKETLRRLKRGQVVVLFPEGTRTRDGRVTPLRSGFAMLARRAGVPIVPVAIDGAWQAWPRTRVLPRPETMQVEYGLPILPEEYEGLNDEQLLAETQRRLEACFALASQKRTRRGGWLTRPRGPLPDEVGKAETKIEDRELRIAN
ncbi:MAG: 1-acyl-sn-glycerol-3-phosphate acyltransferase [Planctomycetia bacterium]|nr:1-acyl-sn-glycerol-3-phosphate acyltransferase [Planctomycetia bacterium]